MLATIIETLLLGGEVEEAGTEELTDNVVRLEKVS